jgi:hypothetical protein
MPEALAYITLLVTAGVLAMLLPFALHRTYLLWLSRRERPASREPLAESELPRVTIQLPVYNEIHVIGRLIDAVCRQDYPLDRFDVQILDDSTDGTTALAERFAEEWRRRGVSVEVVRRPSRTGYKAGALAYGMERSHSEFLLVLDADFVAPSDLIRSLLPPFRDSGVGMVQARWDHLNPDDSWLTKGQSLFLDGHFFFEQGGRYKSGRFFNFNGTAGIWRRTCIEEAGGWRADTLTEDLDLSYRAQMEGWNFVFLEDVGVPAEIPSTVGALEVQQRRWAQGGIQTARKVLPRLLRGPWPLGIKLEATVHLCGHLAHPLTLLLGLLLLPSQIARRTLGAEHYLLPDLIVFAAATLPFLVFYSQAARRRGRSARWSLTAVPQALALGVGLTVAVTRSVLRGLFYRGEDPFLRTPKRGEAVQTSYRVPVAPSDLTLKLLVGVVMVAYLGGALAAGFYGSVPFILLFGSGYLGLGLRGLAELRGDPTRRPEGVVQEQPEHRHPEQQPGPEGLGPEPLGVKGFEAPVAKEYEPA